MPEDSELIRDILDQAREYTPEQRKEYLDRACGGNVELRREVESLLAALDNDREILGSPTLAPPAMRSHVSEGAGSRIGRYRLLQQIGEGGFGVVFMAEQEHPVRRTVALKILKAGMDTNQVVARFEAERQALAMMDHPNIAKVLDAGTTESGRPFFVMELVRGSPITTYCDKHRQSTDERLKLFVQVCHAVQHAHSKGIIHRDLKPSNVLVTVADDGQPVPKVIDFGIAKALAPGQRLTDRTLFTEFRQLLGTPQYMSPEQAESDGMAAADTRTDVYALGVLLYELLTGTTPFEKDRLARAAYDEVRRILLEEEPPNPSTRLSTLAAETLTTLSGQRATDIKRLRQTVRGELDWIVMRAMEKDRNRRYETAVELAQDVKFYLADEPVKACPPSNRYRMAKFARRHKRAIATASVIAAVLVVATFVSVWQAVRATRASRVAVEQEARATLEADKQKSINDFLHDMLSRANPRGSLAGSRRGRSATVLEVVNDAVKQLDGGSLADRPEIEAVLRRTIARVYEELGEGSSVEQLRIAVRLSERANGLKNRVTIELRRNLVDLLRLRPHGPELEATLRENIAILQSLPGDLSQGIRVNYITLAGVLRGDGRLAEAENILRQVVADTEASHGKSDAALVYPIATLAKMLHAQGKLAEAEAMYRRGFDIMRGLPPDPNGDKTGAALQLGHFANLLETEGKLADAESTRREILSIQSRWYGWESPQANYAVATLASVLKSQRKTREIESLWTEVLEARRNVLSETHSPERRAVICASMYRPLVELNRIDEAKAACRNALELSPTAAASTLNDVAWELVTQADPTRHDAPLAVELLGRIVELLPGEATYWNTLGVARYRVGNWQGAVDALDKSRALQNGRNLSWDAFFLAMAHWHLGDRDQAHQWFDQAIGWMDKNQPQNEELLRIRSEAAGLLNPGKPSSPPSTAPSSVPQ